MVPELRRRIQRFQQPVGEDIATRPPCEGRRAEAAPELRRASEKKKARNGDELWSDRPGSGPGRKKAAPVSALLVNLQKAGQVRLWMARHMMDAQ